MIGRTRYFRKPNQYVVTSTGYRKRAYSSLGNEISYGENLAGVSIDEGFEPSTGFRVFNLDNMRQGNRIVLLNQELESGRVVIEFAPESLFSRSNCLFDGDTGNGRGN